LVTQWIAYIRLFDFVVRHVPGHKHTAADGLSRRPRTESDDIDEANEVDIDDFVEAELNAFRLAPVRLVGNNDANVANDGPTADLLNDGYSDESWEIARFLTTLKKPQGMNRNQFRAFKRKALHYAVTDGELYRIAGKNIPKRLVVDSEEQRQEILQSIHDKSGHKGRESTYRRVADRYYWEGCYNDAKSYVASCSECQHRDP